MSLSGSRRASLDQRIQAQADSNEGDIDFDFFDSDSPAKKSDIAHEREVDPPTRSYDFIPRYSATIFI